MKKVIILFTIGTLLIFELVGCNKRSTDSSLFDDLISWDSVQVDLSYIDPFVRENWNRNDLDIPSIDIHLEMLYPVIEDDKYFDVRDSLLYVLSQRISTDSLNHTSKDGVRDYLTQFAEEQLHDYMLDTEQARKLNFDVLSYGIFTRTIDYRDSLVFSRNGIISTILFVNEYTGGAHGNQVAITTNYDLRRNERITIQALFKNSEDPVIKELLLKKLMERFEVESPEDLEFAGVFNYQALDVTNNFYFNDQGITFYYNPYELAAYAFGAIELNLSYAELEPLFSSDYSKYEWNNYHHSNS